MAVYIFIAWMSMILSTTGELGVLANNLRKYCLSVRLDFETTNPGHNIQITEAVLFF